MNFEQGLTNEERRNIKEEYFELLKPLNFQQLKQKIKKAVENYNTKRAHKSLSYLTPKQFELQWSTLELKERPLMVIFDDEINV